MDNNLEKSKPTFYIGHQDNNRVNSAASQDVDEARLFGYDMITSPITNGKFQSAVQLLIEQYHIAVNDAKQTKQTKQFALPVPVIPLLTPGSTDLVPESCSSSIIAMVSPWADVSNSDPIASNVFRQVINAEVAYAAFCGISVVIMPPFFNSVRASHVDTITTYSDVVSYCLGIGPYLQILLPFPMDDQEFQDQKELHDALTPWDAWNHIRQSVKFHPKLSIALSIPRLLPSIIVQERWYSEPLKVLNFTENTFTANAKGYPVLSKAHQTLLTKYMRSQQAPWILLAAKASEKSTNTKSNDEAPTPAEAARKPIKPVDPTPHLTYLRYLQNNQPLLSSAGEFAQGYQDYLQNPLQPLTDNLESVTYEVFEKDPIKYKWYEDAVALALQDLYQKLQRPIILAVVGAGRGPLMTRALLASQKTKVPITPFAVEKNQNAYVLLQHHNVNNPLWGKRVTIVKSDMRSWTGPTNPDGTSCPVDILVSELLGSFADNELSPECLDGVQHVLDPDHGINIPQSYTAHITPIASPRIYTDLLYRPSNPDILKWNIPYVTMLHQFSYLSTESTDHVPPEKACIKPIIKECWDFSHPISEAVMKHSDDRRTGKIICQGLDGGDGWNSHNSRSCHLVFPIRDKQNRGVCHGLAGYFEAVLYSRQSTSNKQTSQDTLKSVELSINPNTMDEKSKDMISWFPIFFPIKTPLFIPDGSEVVVDMRRKTDERKVWYTWEVTVWINIGGIRQRVAASGLHSSYENACLM